jgi:hypothetical protein
VKKQVRQERIPNISKDFLAENKVDRRLQSPQKNQPRQTTNRSQSNANIFVLHVVF